MPTSKQADIPWFVRAATADCAFYVMSSAVLRAHAAPAERLKLGKGSIQVPPDRPLPAALVAKLVKARIEENEKRGYR